MTNKLIQIHVESEIKSKADITFEQQGLTTQGAIKMMLTQVANTGKSPFDNLFLNTK